MEDLFKDTSKDDLYWALCAGEIMRNTAIDGIEHLKEVIEWAYIFSKLHYPLWKYESDDVEAFKMQVTNFTVNKLWQSYPPKN